MNMDIKRHITVNKDIEKDFVSAYDAYSDGLFRLCHFKIQDREQAKDIVQQAFLNTWKEIKKGEKIDNIRAFLYRITNNLIIDWYRKKKPESLEDMADDGFDPPDKNELADKHAEFNWAMSKIHKLSDEDQNLITLRFVEEMEITEISEILKENKNNVSVKIHRAVERLKKILE